MHANMAWFQRDSYPIAKSMSKPTDMRQNSRPVASYAKTVRGNPPLSAGKTMALDLLALVLYIGCLVNKDYSLTLVGKLK